MKMRLDLHIHTLYSITLRHRDAFITYEDTERELKRKNLDGGAIVDHATIKGALRFRDYLKQKGILIIPGEEIKTNSGDIIALGIEEEIEPNLPLKETMDKIRDQNGIVIAPHPLVSFLTYHKGVGEKSIRNNKFDAIEVYNSSVPYFLNWRAYWLAEELKASKVAGSDAHLPEDIGACVTEVFCEKNEDSVIEAIRKGTTKVYGEDRGLLKVLGRRFEQLVSKYLLK